MKIAWHMPTLRRSCCGLSIRALRLADGLRDLGHDITFLVAEHKTDMASNAIAGHRLRHLFAPNAKAMHWSLQALTRRRVASAMVTKLDVDHDIMLSCQPEFVAAYGSRHPLRPPVFICGGTTLLHDEADRRESDARSRFERWPYGLDRFLKHRQEKSAFHKAKTVIFDSHATRELAIRDYRLSPDRCHTIHGGVDPNAFAPPSSQDRRVARKRLGISDADRVLVWTGRISPEKNLSLLLHALGCCRPTPDRVLVVGDGPARNDISTLRERLGLGRLVDLIGEQPDVRPFLHAADAFVFPSRGESFGGSLIEAMACGLACIALRPDGAFVRNASLEILEPEKTGLLVDRADPASLAVAINRLMKDRELRNTLGRSARRRAVTSFTWSKAAAQLNALLVRVSTHEAQGRTSLDFSRTTVALSR